MNIFSALTPKSTLNILFSAILCSSALLTLPAQTKAQPSPEEAQDLAKGLSSAFEKVATIITPSVVSVSAVKKPKRLTKGLKKKFLDPQLEDFLERFQDPDGSGGGGQQGLGTGVIVDTAGYILTNNHVVGEADELIVTLSDKRKFKAELKGRDPKSDIAVIKIKAEGLVPAKLSNSDQLKIGEWVIACGNPFGLNNSITAGIVSAKGRSITGGGQFEDFIQTDAAINPGNSGGPLLNLNGEVVGINTAIFSRSGGYMGIGFAIPITMAKSVMQSLISQGKVVRGWLGVGIQPVSEELAQSFNYKSTDGALVGSISEGSPAARSGFRQGDIITKFGGTKISDVNQLRNLVANTTPGQSIPVEIFRDGAAQTLTVKVDELTAQEKQDVEAENSDSAIDLGVDLQTLSQEFAQQLRTKRTKGVVVTNVMPGGIGESAGLQKGDIIISAQGKPVKTVKELLTIIDEKALSQGVRLVVDSQGMEHFVIIKGE